MTNVRIIENGHVCLALVLEDGAHTSLWSREDEGLWYYVGHMSDDHTLGARGISRSTRWQAAVYEALESAWDEYLSTLEA